MIKNVNDNSMGKDRKALMDSEIEYQKTNKLSLNNLADWYVLEGQSVLSIPLLRKYEYLLKNNLTRVEFEKQYHYKPEYLSKELYETVDLWYLLLFVNDMSTVSEFKGDSILVFSLDTIETLNRIINRENKDLGSFENPIDIKKHYMKDLNKPSKDLIPDRMKERYIPFKRYNDFVNELSMITDDKYMRERYRVFEDYFYDDNLELYTPYTLNKEGLTNMASIYYTEGLNVKYKGKMRFTPGEMYALAPLYSGTVKMKVTDKEGNIIFNRSSDNEINAPTLNIDLRKANDEDIEHLNTVDTKLSSVIFNEQTGSYKMRAIKSDNRNSIEDFPFAKITLEREAENSQLDLERILGNDFFVFNIKYKTIFQDYQNPNARFSFDVIYTKSNGKTETYTDLTHDRKDVYNTNGLTAYLKHAQYNSGRIDKMEIIFYARDIERDDEEFEFGIEELDISTVKVSEEYDEHFVVTTKDWYNVELEYDYKPVSENGKRFFSHKHREGVWFQTELMAIRNYSRGAYRLRSQMYTGFYDREIRQQNMGKIGHISFEEGRRWYDENSLNYVYSKNFTFPNDYIITVKMKVVQKSGGAGIIIDYDPSTKEGYMIWNPGPKSNWGVPYFHRDPDPYNVMPPGFHEIDNTHGKLTPIFVEETEKALHVTNSKEFPVEDQYIKIIKNDNRIRVFSSPDRNFDYANPDVDMYDIENVKNNGSLGFISSFSGLEVEFVEYYRFQDINEVDTSCHD